MFKRNSEEHELLKKRIEKLNDTVTSMAGYVGYKGDRLWSLAIYDKPALKIRVDVLEEKIDRLNGDIVDIKNILVDSGIIKVINDETPALKSYMVGWNGREETQYGLVKPVKAGKKRG